MCSASSTWLISGSCAPNSSGVLRPAGFVLRVLRRPERRAGQIERDRDVGRDLVAQRVDEHRGEAEHRVRGLPGRGREVLRRQRVERAVRERVAVEEQQPRPRAVVDGPRRRPPASLRQPSASRRGRPSAALRLGARPAGHGREPSLGRRHPPAHGGAMTTDQIDPRTRGRAARRDDGHRDPRGLRGPGRRDHAGRRQHPAVRAAPRRRDLRAGRDRRVDRSHAPRRRRAGRRRGRHQRDPPPRDARRRRHRRRDAAAPRPHGGLLRDRGDRRGGPPRRDRAAHLPAHRRAGRHPRGAGPGAPARRSAAAGRPTRLSGRRRPWRRGTGGRR